MHLLVPSSPSFPHPPPQITTPSGSPDPLVEQTKSKDNFKGKFQGQIGPSPTLMESRSTASRVEVGKERGPGGTLHLLLALNLREALPGARMSPSRARGQQSVEASDPGHSLPIHQPETGGDTPSLDHTREQDTFYAYSHFILIASELGFIIPFQFAEGKTVSPSAQTADPGSELMCLVPDSPCHLQAAAQGRGAGLAQAFAPRVALLHGSWHFIKLLSHPPDSRLLWGSTLVFCLQEVPSDF